MEAGTLNCPECGAAVSQDSTRCQYCTALLQTVACPRCLKMMFAGSKYCPHCGALAADVTRGKMSPRLCPRCQVMLIDIRVADTPLEQCTKCRGAWVDIGSFEHICEIADQHQVATGYRLPPRPQIDPHVHYLPCPQCRNLMARVNYAGRSGIVVDVCRAHGIWLDHDEMLQIIAFIRSGGLQHARDLELHELEEARRRANGEQVEDAPLQLQLADQYHSMTPDHRVSLMRELGLMARHLLS